MSLNFKYYNHALPHDSLRVEYADGTYTKSHSTRAAELADHIWPTWEIAELLD